MNKPKIILVGAGGHCRSCIDVIEQEDRFQIAGVVDKKNSEMAASVLGYPLLGYDDDLPQLHLKYTYALVTVGQIKSSSVRIRLFGRLKEIGFSMPVIISPLAYVSMHSEIDGGTIVMHQALVNAGVKVGQNCILNTGCLIEHDSVVGNFTHISTHAVLNGGVIVGGSSFVGSGATIVPGVVLPNESFVKAQQLVVSPGDCRGCRERG